MKKPKTLAVVTDMPRTNVTPDGAYAEMELTYSNGTSQFLRFSPKTFYSLLNKVFELLLNHKMQTDAARGFEEDHPLPVRMARAQEAVGGEVVIVLLRMENGLPASFSIQQAEAEELHRQLGLAIEKAKAQRAASRH